MTSCPGRNEHRVHAPRTALARGRFPLPPSNPRGLLRGRRRPCRSGRGAHGQKLSTSLALRQASPRTPRLGGEAGVVARRPDDPSWSRSADIVSPKGTTRAPSRRYPGFSRGAHLVFALRGKFRELRSAEAGRYQGWCPRRGGRDSDSRGGAFQSGPRTARSRPTHGDLQRSSARRRFVRRVRSHRSEVSIGERLLRVSPAAPQSRSWPRIDQRVCVESRLPRPRSERSASRGPWCVQFAPFAERKAP